MSKRKLKKAAPKQQKKMKAKAKKPTAAQVKKVLDDPKQRKKIAAAAKEEGNPELAEQLRTKAGREEAVSDSDVVKLIEHAKEKTAAHAAEVKRLEKLGLVECPVRGSPFSLVGLADPKAEPTLEQRREMARRLIEVGPKLPRYLGVVGHLIDERKPVSSTKAVVSVAEAITSGKEYREQQAKEKAKEKKKEKAAPAPAAKKEGKPAAKPAAGKKFDVPKVPKEGFSKTNKPATSGELIRARIMEHKLTDEQIAAEVRKLFEGRNTQVSDVRWNRGQMRKAGIDAPDPVGEAPQSPKGKK